MRFRLIFSIVGIMGVLCGLTMSFPMVLDFWHGHQDAAARFAVSSAISVFIGGTIYLLAHAEKEPLRTKEMFLTTTLVWLTYTCFASIPFYLSPYQMSVTDSFFEAMSGLTTTGATVLSNLDFMTPGILLWRSLLQWIGGVGIVIVAILILPALHVGGMQLFNTESSAQSQRDTPMVAKNLQAIILYFVGLSVACTVSLYLAGMGLFDAINHTMTAISTGGFSTHDMSIAYFQNPAIEWVLIFFMTVSALPLILGLHIFQHKIQSIKDNSQIAFFLKFLFCALVVLVFYRWTREHFVLEELEQYVRETLFSIVSVITTTGYVTVNYQLWGNFSVAVFMVLLAMGGCTGSATGGIKMFRFTILFRAIAVRLKTLVQPHGVFVARYGRQVIDDDVLISVLVFFGLYLMTAIVVTFTMSLFGYDFVTGLSAAFTSLSGVGPGLGSVIGPDKTFASLPDTIKWVLSFAMLIGRLEFVSVFVLFFPFLWRKNV